MPGNELFRQLTRYDIVPIILVVGVTVVLTRGMRIEHDMTGWVIASILVSLVIGVILHEFGHAVAALTTGAHVDFVRLGPRISNRKPWVIPFFAFPIHVHGFPACGSVHSSLYDIRHYRTKRCFMVAAGPGVNSLLLLAAFVLVPHFSGPEGRSILLGWMLANAAALAVSVFPMKVASYGNIQGNDALIFWDTIHYPDEKVRQIVDHAVQTRGMTMDVDAMEAMSITELEAKHTAEPTNAPVLMILIGKLREVYDPRHLDYLLKLIELPLPKEVLGEFIDSGITTQLNQGPGARPEITDQLSLRLLSLNDTVSTRGTRGSVLVDLGRVDEGRAMLQDVLWKTESEFDKVYVHIFLALAEAKSGDRRVAHEHAIEARKIDSNCPALPRVSDLLNTHP